MLNEACHIVVLGTGNAAEAFAIAFSRAHQQVSVWGRNAEKGATLAARAHVRFIPSLEDALKSDLMIIAVSDDAIEELASLLALRRQPSGSSPLMVHISGSTPMAVLAPYARQFGVMYPLMSLSSGRELDFRKVPILLEASDKETYSRLMSLAGLISDQCLEADSATRMRLHLSAVFGCNFVNYLIGLASSLASPHFDLLKPAIREVLEKALAAPHPRQVQTGPAVRGDQYIMQMHEQLLAADPELKELYQRISKLIQEEKEGIS